MKRLLDHPFARTHAPQFLKFALCGGLGAFIDLGTLTLQVEYFGVEPHLAFIVSTLCAVSFVFMANKHFTFRNHEVNYAHQAFKFALVYGAAVLFNISISSGLLWLGVHYLLSKMLAIGTVAVWNYALSHGFVFRRKVEVDAAVF